MQLHFENPYLLLGALPALALAGLMIFNRRRHRSATTRRRIALVTAGLLLCVLGLSRPQLGRRDTETQSVRANIFFAIDVSRSMLAEDVPPSRLEFAAAFAKKLLEQLGTVRVALFPFTVEGFIQMPLTNDVFVMSDMLGALSPAIMSGQGTDLTYALELLFRAIARMELAATEKGNDWFPTQVVLISDGESHHPIAEGILKEYRKKSIPIYTVGVGTAAGALIALESRFQSGGDFFQDRPNSTVKTQLHAENLKKISDATGGDYFTSRFEEVYPLAKRISQSMRMAKLTTSFRVEKECYPIIFLIAFILLAIEFAAGRWAYLIRSVVFGFALFAYSGNALAAPNDDDPLRAYRAYNEGVEAVKQKDFPKAAELFQESSLLAQDASLKKKALFNLGDVLVRLQDPQNALQSMQQAFDTHASDKSFEKETNQKLSENMILATKLLEELQKQSKPGEGNDPSDGASKKPPDDPKGPKKNYQGQMFTESQKQRIFDLISNDEQQTIQRLNEQRNKKSAQNQEKPW